MLAFLERWLRARFFARHDEQVARLVDAQARMDAVLLELRGELTRLKALCELEVKIRERSQNVLANSIDQAQQDIVSLGNEVSSKLEQVSSRLMDVRGQANTASDLSNSLVHFLRYLVEEASRTMDLRYEKVDREIPF